MQIYGYHRTSTKEQHLDRGIQEIERYCNEHEMALTNIFTDQETGKNFNRPRYTVLVEDVLRPGDVLIVTNWTDWGETSMTPCNRSSGLRIWECGLWFWNCRLRLWIYL